MLDYFNLLDMLDEVYDKLEKEDKENEVKKRGILRGGNSGCITPDGTCYGYCPRISLARFEGIQTTKDKSTKLMFRGGHAHELELVDALKRAGEDIKCESEIPVETSFEMADGDTVNTYRITGSPDIVIMKDAKPFCVLELKNISSIWSLVNRLIKGVPTSSHLIQLALYNMLLSEQYGMEELHGKLVYTSYINFHTLWNRTIKGICEKIPHAKKLFKLKKDELFCINPRRFVYDIKWINGQLHYKYENDDVLQEDKYIRTIITKGGIINYYKSVIHQKISDTLSSAPTDTHIDHLSKEHKPCEYCDFSEVCADKENTESTSKWLDAVRFFIAKENK